MEIKPYKYLSRIYGQDWGHFADQYTDFVLQHLTDLKLKNMQMLDLACGTGILAIKMSFHVASILGIDRSHEMINIARSNATRIKNVTFKIGDMRRFVTKGQYDLCTCSFDSINYLLTYSDLRDFFTRVNNSLRDGGLFIFDSNTDVLYRTFNGMSRKLDTVCGTVMQTARYVRSKRRNYVTFDFPGGYRETHVQRPYNYSELAPRLKKAGFKIMAKYGKMKMDRHTARSRRLYIVAKKI